MWVGWALNLLAAVAWSVNDALRKRLAVDAAPVPLAAWLSLGPVPIFLAWAVWDGRAPTWEGYLLPGLGSTLLNVVASVLFVASLRVSPLATTIPMLSLTPALSTLGAWVVLGEVPAPDTLAAVFGIVAGTLALPFAGGLSAEQLRGQRGMPMMAGVALCWAMTMVLDKMGAGRVGVPLHLAVVNAGVGGALSMGLLATGRRGQLVPGRGQLGLLGLVVLVVAVATGAQLLALERLPVAVVDGTKRALGMALAALMGWRWFGERLSGLQGLLLVALAVAVGGLAVS